MPAFAALLEVNDLRMVEPPRWGAVSSVMGTVIPEGTGLCQQGRGPVVLLAFGLRVDSTG